MKISHLIVGLLCLASLLFIGYAISILPVKITVILIIGFIFSVLTMINLEVGLFLLIFVVPFTQQLTIGKVGVYPVDIGTDDALIIFIILSWLAGIVRRKEPLFLKTSLDWPIIAFFTAAIFSFIGAGMRFGMGIILVGVLHVFKFFEYVVIYFIVVSAIKDFQQIKRYLLMFFIVTGFILAMHFLAMILYKGYNLSIPPEVVERGSVTIMYFILGSTLHIFMTNATFGAYYCFFLSILLAIILDTPFSKGKILLTFFAFAISFGLFNTFSRSAYVGLMASFFILALLKEKRFFIIILMLLVFSPIYMQSAILQRIVLTIESFKPLTFDASAAQRIYLWKKAIAAFFNSPIFGTGFWTIDYVMGGKAHSQYLGILVETGIIGFSIFCWLIVRMVKNSMNFLKRADTVFLKSFGVGYIAGFIGILTICFFSEVLDTFHVLGMLWFVTGLVSSANRLLSEKTEKLDIDNA